MSDWQNFVATHGAGARVDHLAHVCGVPVAEVQKLRRRGIARGGRAGHAEDRFADLFRLWHGRPPEEAEWPPPRRLGHGEYEWQPPEVAALAGLVGRFGIEEMAQILTTRLRERTGDATAFRNRNAVLTRMQLIGLQTTDLVGGIGLKAAADVVGSKAIIQNAVRLGQLRTFRVGRLHVIPYPVWEKWLAERATVPPGHVKLSSLRERLSITSDKLSEWARAGKIPGAVQVNTCGHGDARGTWGTWYLPEALAAQLLEDRRLGRRMPWHGQPDIYNLKVTWKRLQERRHPDDCPTCRQIWGEAGAPVEFEDYLRRYPPLAHGAKRHLTRIFTPGMTIGELAAETGQATQIIDEAIANGTLTAHGYRATRYITRTDAALWITRGCPTGANKHSWAALPTAVKQFDFSEAELLAFIADGRLATKLGTNGPIRGITYVSRWQCRMLRGELGYTEQQAAEKLRIGVPRLRELLATVNWRGTAGIPLVTLQAVRQRLESREGFEIETAAAELGKSVEWVRQQIHDGIVRVAQAPWDRRRQYLSAPMMERLRAEIANPTVRETWTDNWLLLSKAAGLAGVSPTTIIQWGEKGLVTHRESQQGRRYSRGAVMAQARSYWANSRYKRDLRPAWLVEENACTS